MNTNKRAEAPSAWVDGFVRLLPAGCPVVSASRIGWDDSMSAESIQRGERVGAARALWGVVKFLGHRPGWVALSIGLLLVNISIELSLPQILGNTITQLGRGGVGQSKSLAWAVGTFFGLVTIRTLVGILLGPIRNRTAQETLGDIRSAVYEALQRQSFSWHDNARLGELISRAGTDVGRLQEFVFVCLLFSVDLLVGLAGSWVLIFLLSPVLGWLALASMGPTVLCMGLFAVRLQPRWRVVHDRHSAMSTVVQENIAGVRVVKAFARESAEVLKFRRMRDDYLLELFRTIEYWSTRVPFAQFVFGLGIPLVLWAGGGQVIDGRLALGDLAKAVFYLLALGNRIAAIGQVTNIIQNASSAAQRIHEVLSAPGALVNGSTRLPASGPGAGRVQFESVTFSYPQRASLQEASDQPGGVAQTRVMPGTRSVPALMDLSFVVEPGELVAVVGATGAGKSTLLSLIPRFYDPDGGRVCVDGVDVRALELTALRRSVGMVFQETFLFSATVAENLAFGRPGASRADLERVARLARAHGFICGLESGYDTVVGERGVSLSGGQRQRLAIARALLVEPRIVLLDDATSAVDPATEREIREAIAELCRGRTTFVVAHRAASVRRADRILVLSEGRLVEQGKHADLVARGGVYAAWFRSQSTPEPGGEG